jgi:hypothetical protein
MENDTRVQRNGVLGAKAPTARQTTQKTATTTQQETLAAARRAAMGGL